MAPSYMSPNAGRGGGWVAGYKPTFGIYSYSSYVAPSAKLA